MTGPASGGGGVWCAVAALVLASCLGGDPVAEKEGTGEERHDLAPLTQRFDHLEGASDVTWYSGTFGDDRAPGPSSHWIDAVVQLPPDVADALEAEHGPTSFVGRPEVVEGLLDDLPEGPLVSSEELADAVGGGSGWTLDVWLAPESDALVLVARGQ